MCSSRSAGNCFSLSPTTSLPATCTLPEVAVRMHPMIESSVVLPLPEGPHQHEQFARVHVEIDAAQSQRSGRAFVVVLGELSNCNCRLHRSPFPSA